MESVIGTGEKVSEDTMLQLLVATGAVLDEEIIEHAAYDRLVDTFVSGTTLWLTFCRVLNTFVLIRFVNAQL